MTLLARTYHHRWVMGGAERGSAGRSRRRRRLRNADRTGRRGARGGGNASRTGRSGAGSGEGMKGRGIPVMDRRDGHVAHPAASIDQIALNMRMNLRTPRIGIIGLAVID